MGNTDLFPVCNATKVVRHCFVVGFRTDNPRTHMHFSWVGRKIKQEFKNSIFEMPEETYKETYKESRNIYKGRPRKGDPNNTWNNQGMSKYDKLVWI